MAERSQRLDLRGACAEFAASRGVSRRQVLRAGTLGALGLGLPQWLSRSAGAGSTEGAGGAGGGKAKRCIFFFMWGGPSQLDTFDLKPEAPAEVRGPFRPIASRVPGLQLCEHFQELSRFTDRLAVVRSLHHADPAHLSSGHLILTGHFAPTINSDAAPPSDRDWPHLGSMMSSLRPTGGELPGFVTMPWLTAHPAAPGGRAPGQTGGWLGHRYDPFLIQGDPNRDDWSIPELQLAGGVSLERLEDRHGLLAMVDQQRGLLDAAAADFGGLSERAFGLLTSTATREAFDLGQEPVETRERYGRNIHGQCALLARRLVEHGVPFVSVNWHDDGQNFWDTHANNFKRLERELIPTADRALASLLSDLEERGLLEETLVVWVGEFGRKPQINNAGREHWPFCYSGLLAGGGVQGGAVWGRSDALGARPVADAVRPQDFVATVMHALGMDPEEKVMDRGGRPVMLCEGTPLKGLFG